MTDRYYVLGPYENSRNHTIARDNPAGGDPITVCTLRRIYRPDELYRICDLANRMLEREAMSWSRIS